MDSVVNTDIANWMSVAFTSFAPATVGEQFQAFSELNRRRRRKRKNHLQQQSKITTSD